MQNAFFIHVTNSQDYSVDILGAYCNFAINKCNGL